MGVFMQVALKLWSCCYVRVIDSSWLFNWKLSNFHPSRCILVHHQTMDYLWEKLFCHQNLNCGQFGPFEVDFASASILCLETGSATFSCQPSCPCQRQRPHQFHNELNYFLLWNKSLWKVEKPESTSAFDALSHRLMLSKLVAYGVSVSACELVQSSKKRCQIDDRRSKWEYIKCGVSQGSICGPLLFNILLNDLFHFVTKVCTLYNYAVDNTLTYHLCCKATNRKSSWYNSHLVQ